MGSAERVLRLSLLSWSAALAVEKKAFWVALHRILYLLRSGVSLNLFTYFLQHKYN